MQRRLTLSQRQQIEKMQQAGATQAAMARAIGVHRSTVKRELDRNSKQGVYNSQEAHYFCKMRRIFAGINVYCKAKNSDTPALKKIERKLPRLSGERLKAHPRKRVISHRPYVPRPDRREWHKHPHKNRRFNFEYWSRKKWYDERYRWRDYGHEESQRMLRCAADWRRYSINPNESWLKKGIFGQHYRRLLSRVRRVELARKLFHKTEDRLEQLLEQAEIAQMERDPEVIIQAPSVPFFFLLIEPSANSLKIRKNLPLPDG